MPTPDDPSAVISRAVRTDVPLPDDISEVELRQYALERELGAMRDRVRHLEQALRAAGRVLQPYLGSNGRQLRASAVAGVVVGLADPKQTLSVAEGSQPNPHPRDIMQFASSGGLDEKAAPRKRRHGWSWKSEFLYIDYGQAKFFDPADTCSPDCRAFLNPREVSLKNYVFRTGLNYKFDWGWGKAPVAVMAKY